MANTRVTMLTALATALEGLTGVNKATLDLVSPIEQRQFAPYVGVLASTERLMAEDATKALYDLSVDLILVQEGNNIENLLTAVRDYCQSSTTAAAIGAKSISVDEVMDVNLIYNDAYSTTRLVTTIYYTSTKGAS